MPTWRHLPRLTARGELLLGLLLLELLLLGLLPDLVPVVLAAQAETRRVVGLLLPQCLPAKLQRIADDWRSLRRCTRPR